MELHRVGIEEVVDVDDSGAPTPKEKKKKKKKKKKKAASEPVAPPLAAQLPSSPVTAPAARPLASSVRQPPVKSAAPPLPTSSVNTLSTTAPEAHPVVPEARQVVAESARKYLQNENLDLPKSKVKSRRDPTTLPLAQGNSDKKGFFSRFSKDKSKVDEGEMKKAKNSWFSKLTKKARGYMKQLLWTSDD